MDNLIINNESTARSPSLSSFLMTYRIFGLFCPLNKIFHGERIRGQFLSPFQQLGP
jgi:hypothetical protein